MSDELSSAASSVLDSIDVFRESESGDGFGAANYLPPLLAFIVQLLGLAYYFIVVLFIFVIAMASSGLLVIMFGLRVYRGELPKPYGGKSKSFCYLAEKGPRELNKGEYAVNKLQRYIPHIWNTSKKSEAPYGGSGVAHLTSMPSLPLLITGRSSHKPEDKRVSKIKKEKEIVGTTIGDFHAHNSSIGRSTNEPLHHHYNVSGGLSWVAENLRRGQCRGPEWEGIVHILDSLFGNTLCSSQGAQAGRIWQTQSSAEALLTASLHSNHPCR
ncbi:UNVERIFIED_CONTAM: hypothetical protein Scaly_2369100 [Sesamum calycinum]|uniref:Uncharacterized protein n=1 Tax=Sesamum calycinum TaxID=2727403 RepID=A0AAW2LXY0_9LAMI